LEWIQLARDSIRWRTLIKAEGNGSSSSIRGGELLDLHELLSASEEELCCIKVVSK